MLLSTQNNNNCLYQSVIEQKIRNKVPLTAPQSKDFTLKGYKYISKRIAFSYVKAH